jgi:hypothetical protein
MAWYHYGFWQIEQGNRDRTAHSWYTAWLELAVGLSPA